MIAECVDEFCKISTLVGLCNGDEMCLLWVGNRIFFKVQCIFTLHSMFARRCCWTFKLGCADWYRVAEVFRNVRRIWVAVVMYLWCSLWQAVLSAGLNLWVPLPESHLVKERRWSSIHLCRPSYCGHLFVQRNSRQFVFSPLKTEIICVLYTDLSVPRSKHSPSRL